MKKTGITAFIFLIILVLNACTGAPEAGTPSFNTTGSSSAEHSEEVSAAPETTFTRTSEAAQNAVFIPDENTFTQYSKSELSFTKDGGKIYGELYMPDSELAVPLIVMVNGFGVNLLNLNPYAEFFAGKGFAVYNFDFPGGHVTSFSDGDMSEMSVLTEAEVLDFILDNVQGIPGTDPERLILFGESQGGLVSLYVAAHRPKDIAGIITLYPALSLRDMITELLPENGTIPETLVFLGENVSSIYIRDILSFDIYDYLDKYPGKVRIIHGTEDKKVPISYSERALDIIPDAKLFRIEGADHGFSGDYFETAVRKAHEFALEIIRQDTSAWR